MRHIPVFSHADWEFVHLIKVIKLGGGVINTWKKCCLLVYDNFDSPIFFCWS